MSDESKLATFLKVGAASSVAAPRQGESLKRAEFTLTNGTIEVPEDAPEGDALAFLEDAGQDPTQWEVTGFRRSEWGNPEDPFVSTRFTFRKRDVAAEGERVDIDDLLALIHADTRAEPVKRDWLNEPSLEAAAVLIGDMQFGQIGATEDPFEAIENTLSAIDRVADELDALGGAEQLLVAWLGDHVEGFTSQGGRNIWRTRLTLSEQIRATRRVMFYAVERLAPLCDRLVMAAVPGNHGRVETANGSKTRADDNHDVEALNAVAEALSMSDRYRDVECVVPERDEISLAVKVGGATWGLVHGDIWKRPGKHFDWWQEQVFHGRPTAGADFLAAGHFHYLLVHQEGGKTFFQVPTLGTDGKWWEHQHGSFAHPGIVLAITEGKEVTNVVPVNV